MKYTKSISYICVNPYQGFPIFLTTPDVPPQSGTDVKMNINGKLKDCYFEEGVVTFINSNDAPQQDTTSLYLIYEAE